MSQPQRAKSSGVTPPEVRHEPAARKRMSGSALRAFFAIAEKWRLDLREQRGLLGWPSKSALYNWKATPDVTLPYDTLVRLSLILGIYKALHILYPDEHLADGWMKMRNRNPLFGGRAPIEHALREQSTLQDVRRLLDARRGGWS